MEKLNRNLLSLVKKGFVEMPAGQGPGPVAGGGMMTQAQAAPMGDPNAGAGGIPPGADPMMGMPPPDPSMAGGDPNAAAAGAPPPDAGAAPAAPPPPDPAAMAPPTGQIILSPADLIQIIESVKGAGGASPSKSKSSGGAAAPAGGGGNSDQKLDQILGILQSAMGGAGAPPTVQ